MRTGDKQLVDQARQGEVQAFEALVLTHQKAVYTLALRLTGSHHDAEEITQTVFLKAWRGLPAFRGEAAFSTWLYRLTRNACTDFLRRQGKCREDRSLDDPDLPPAADAAPSPEEAVLQRERQQALTEAMEKLPEQARTILLLREVQGLDYQAIAQALDLPVGTVRSRLARARRALRDLLAEGNLFAPPASKNGKGGGTP